MSQLIYFVTENYLKVNTTVTANVDIISILPLIKGAADMWTRNTLGTYFYEYLLAAYNAQTLTSDETTLVGYMQPAIAWRACADSILELSYQLKNKGVQTQSGDFSASPEMKAIMLMNHHYVQKAEFYENRLWEYLKKNKALFPQFTDPLNRDSTCLYSLREDRGGKFNTSIFLV